MPGKSENTNKFTSQVIPSSSTGMQCSNLKIGQTEKHTDSVDTYCLYLFIFDLKSNKQKLFLQK